MSSARNGLRFRMFLAFVVALVTFAREADAQHVWWRRYDMPLNLRAVEPATEVGAELATTIFPNNRWGFVARPFFGVRIYSWEVSVTVPITASTVDGGVAALGNIELMVMKRFMLGEHFRMSLGFGGYAPTHSGFDGPTASNQYQLRDEGLWSTGGYLPGFYTPGYVIPHFHLGFAWNPGNGIFTLSAEFGSELRILVSSSPYYQRHADMSLFGGFYLAFRVAHWISIGAGWRAYGWVTQNGPFSVAEGQGFAGSWSAVAGVRFHAGAFEPGFGVIFTTPGPGTSELLWQGAAIYADIRARW